MATDRDKLNQLISQRELLELEAEAITSELTSPGPNGERPIGIKDSLVDAEGFPRADIDVYRARNQRNRLAVINTDHKALMKEIEKLMHLVYQETANTPLTSNNTTNRGSQVDIPPVLGSDTSLLSPYAVIDEILPNSPASICGLQDGDKLIAFETITANATNPLVLIPNVVRQNIGKPIPIIVRRHNEDVRIHLTPQVWSGRGVLGCHLTPIRS
jgi:26S proteasome regulatory subunit N4